MISYVIVAYHQPAFLSRLVDALRAPDVFFYIHIDARVDLAPFEACLPPAADVHYVQTRYGCHWGGYGLVEAFLAGARAALADACEGYIVTMCGSSYPLQPPQAIRHFLEASPGTCYLSWFGERFHRHHLSWRLSRRLLPLQSPPRKGMDVLLLPTFNPRKIFASFETFRLWLCNLDAYFVRRKVPPCVGKISGGEGWTIFPADYWRRIFAWLAENPEFEAFFRKVLISGELFFTTLHGALPAPHRPLPWYLDWECGHDGSPAVLTADDDFERFSASGALFARKFDAVKSARLLDRIDSELLGRPASDPGSHRLPVAEEAGH
ncbi:beta-1,6-N-acetylglucosaminyltransferase [Crenobacter intestini]|uniref:beta-1,6-N-acetylglucosaminyltransferase n=1 Tax=Crenobacter intestini TaxID=2563443 RepID=UPI0014587BEE|nr:beta-1,6-N-acetylglucosaminyltransferase [Crenobacter intestini]